MLLHMHVIEYVGGEPVYAIRSKLNTLNNRFDYFGLVLNTFTCADCGKECLNLRKGCRP